MADIIFSSPEQESMGEKIRAWAVNDEKKTVSSGSFIFCDSAFGSGFVKTMVAGGIHTEVESRRGGNVRRMFDLMHKEAEARGVGVALLHPFSFSYYRKFGYEKVSDHVIVSCPLRVIDFVERGCELVKYTSLDQTSDLCKIYNEFALGRGLLVARHNAGYFQLDIPNRYIYIYYDNGNPSGYVTYTLSESFVVNRMTNGVLTVEEIAYTSPCALRAIFSFLRLYEGEMDEIVFSNIAPCPEVELLLSHYNHTSYKRVPDVMARVINTELMLKSAAYPKGQGSFSVKVEDTLDSVDGSFFVEWEDGKTSVSRLDTTALCDIECDAAAFTRLIYGYDGVGAKEASFMRGVKINNSQTDFFKVFVKRYNGNFEHF